MKLKYNFEMVDLEGEVIAVPVGNDDCAIKGVLRLNKEGMEIFELLKNDIEAEDIIRIINGKYDTDYLTTKEYVMDFINSLSEMKVLE